MNHLSLFSGISSDRVALEYAGVTNIRTIASEIYVPAIKIASANYPDIKHAGDITLLTEKWLKSNCGEVDLLTGGPPCQDLSIAKKDRKGLRGDKSKLFYEFVRVRDIVRPRYFIMENVRSMHDSECAVITETLGVQPVMIDAALVSAQNRKRYYWVGERVRSGYRTVSIPLPEDTGELLADIVETGIPDRQKSFPIAASVGNTTPVEYLIKKKGAMVPLSEKQMAYMHKICSDGRTILERGYSHDVRKGKSGTLTAGLSRGVPCYVLYDGRMYRRITPLECERLQGLPDYYTHIPGVSPTAQYKCIGNCFNVKVFTYLIGCLHL